ncbi:MAG: flagellar hook assembly protein FlgD [Proteobacteria bacterium]|nr:flagellar hook assembly protein FlgD [Pseudomonadota bacterium]
MTTSIVGTPANTFPTPAALPTAAPAANPNSSTGGGTDTKALNQNFDQFLTLLTTQLKNQDPLAPMDSTQFTNQLVSFSGVEQQIKTNENLAKLLSNSSTSQTTMGLSYIGLNVNISGTQFDFNPKTDASVKLNYTLPSDAAINTVSILDQNGNTVYTTKGELSSGAHAFARNGTDQNGQAVPAGTYSLQVGALDANQKNISVATTVPGRVTGIETASDGSIDLMVGTLSTQLVPMSSVTQASM